MIQLTHAPADTTRRGWLSDLLREELPEGYSPSPNTLSRWIRQGMVAPHGTRVRLNAVLIGGRYTSTRADVRAFFAALEQTAAPADEQRHIDVAKTKYAKAAEVSEAVAPSGRAETVRSGP